MLASLILFSLLKVESKCRILLCPLISVTEASKSRAVFISNKFWACAYIVKKKFQILKHKMSSQTFCIFSQ